MATYTFYKFTFIYVLFVSSCLLVQSQIVNFIPYTFSNCLSANYAGTGYSFPVGKCITGISTLQYSANSNWKVTIDQYNSSILLQSFSSSDTECLNPQQSFKYENDTCTPAEYTILEFNVKYVYPFGPYVRPIISDTPHYSSNSVVFENYENSCSKSNLHYSVTFDPLQLVTEGTTWFTIDCSDSGQPVTTVCHYSGIFCEKSIPIAQQCKNNLSIYCTPNF